MTKSISQAKSFGNNYLKRFLLRVTYKIDRLTNYTLESLYHTLHVQVMPTISLVPNYKTRDYKYDVLSFTLNKKKIFVLLTPERGKHSINLQKIQQQNQM